MLATDQETSDAAQGETNTQQITSNTEESGNRKTLYGYIFLEIIKFNKRIQDSTNKSCSSICIC